MTKNSNLLFHFTPSIENLKSILQTGFKPHFVDSYVEFRKKINKYDWQYYKVADVPMVSFCNIYLSEIKQHTPMYGSYAIGMSKKWAVRHSANPVAYISHNSLLAKTLGWSICGFDLMHLDDSQKAYTYSGYFMKNDSAGTVKGKQYKKYDFTAEKEWLYVPPIHTNTEEYDKIFPTKATEKQYAKANRKIEKYAMQFDADDIKYIVVKNYAEITEMIEFLKLNGNAPLKGAYPLKLITLEQLEEDF